MNLFERTEQKSTLLLALLLFLIFIYPLLGMLWHHQYPLFSPEVALLLAGFLLLAFMLSWLLQFSRLLVSNLALAAILIIVFLVHFNLFFQGMIVVLAVALLASVLLKEQFKNVLLALIIALIVGAWLDSRISPATQVYELTASDAPSSRGPVIHLLMDGFMGPDGLPPDEDSQELRDEIISFFKRYDFQLYTRAYTHYNATVDSMTRAFNFRNDDANLWQIASMLRTRVSFTENAWFKALNDIGYDVVVYQSESMDFCDVALSGEIRCNTFPMPNLGTIHEEVKNVSTRAAVLLRTLASQSAMLLKALRDARLLGTWGVSIYDERILERLTHDISLQPGNLYFAHVLLPHSPSIFRQDCTIDYELEPKERWPASQGLIGNSVETQEMRYKKILPQVRCALKKLETVFETLKELNLYDDATIVLHGDHGISGYIFGPHFSNMARMSYRDLRESFSLLFAVKYPGETFTLNEETVSLNILMARTAMRITGKSAEELGIEVIAEDEPFIYLNGVHPLKRGDVNIFDKDKPATDQL